VSFGDGPVCVLDIETRPWAGASALLAPGDRPRLERHMLQEISAASTLEFAITADGMAGLSMSTFMASELGEAELLLALDGPLSRCMDGGGTLVTHNGRAHDVPVCSIRAMHHWLFRARSFGRWRRDGQARHVDTMLAFGREAGRGPSLVDLAAGLGFSAVPGPRSVVRPLPELLRKGQVDVVCTAIAYLFLVAEDRGDPKWLAAAWSAMSRFLLSPPVRASHLMHLADPGRGLDADVGR
jgi:hypothetical protein